MKKQTAVEWLEQSLKLSDNVSEFDKWAFDKAKSMEQKQIINAFEAAEKDCGRDFLHGDLYYNETFKSE